MKKLVLTISFLCYLTVTCGVVVNLHYCMDRLASVHLFGGKDDSCAECGMQMHASNKCCHDEVRVFKLEQDQNNVSIPDYSIPAMEEIVVRPSEFFTAPFYTAGPQPVTGDHSPPRPSEQAIYLQINVFRI